MPKTRKTWRQKLEEEHPEHGKVVDIPPKMQNRFGTGKMLIPKPMDINALINKISKGKLVTVTQIREKLAKDAHANCSCPMTTGIFLRIVAEVAEEDLRNEKREVTPYWRVIKADGSLNEKFPGGAQAQAAHLKKEGHGIESGKGRKPPRVKKFEESLQKL
ncbi:MAG: MGMT family protein [Chloroflexi bacterium]|nr:MGMT family protein [Chloroflexota bacterium]MBL7061664.1 MGMT family protein [Dehalococcoidia bacterium]